MSMRTMKKPKMTAASPAAAAEMMIVMRTAAATIATSAQLRQPNAARPPMSIGGKL
jgi:hypothetical protein